MGNEEALEEQKIEIWSSFCKKERDFPSRKRTIHLSTQVT